jgi:hypothetical protein
MVQVVLHHTLDQQELVGVVVKVVLLVAVERMEVLVVVEVVKMHQQERVIGKLKLQILQH